MPIPSRTEYCWVHPEPGTQKIFPSVRVPSMSKIITESRETRCLSASRSRFIAVRLPCGGDCSEHRLALLDEDLEFHRTYPVLLQDLRHLFSQLGSDRL